MSTHTLLFEIGTEELPAFYVDEGREGLHALLTERLQAARLPFEAVEMFSTPRRLTARVSGLAAHQPRQETRRRGPGVKAGEKAAAGFATSLGLTPADLVEEGGYLYATVVDEGRPAAEVLPDLLADVVRDLPAKRKMRWGDVTDCEFVRPVAWLVALLDDQVLPVKVAGLTAGRTSRGHRFMAGHDVQIASPAAYESALYTAHVVASQTERRELVLNAARQAAPEGHETVVPDDLLDEVVNLVEYPTAYLGTIDGKYLVLPDEVLAETMIVHQRYFPVRGATRLANRFVVISNNRVPDPSIPMVGYQQVLDGRLSDARFFWDHDVARPLGEFRTMLSGRAFQKGLGSMLDKADRVHALSLRLAQHLNVDTTHVAVAASLHLADLSTQMVYEYADLAGVMGRAYALNAGVQPEVADLLAQAVQPVTAEADLPQSAEGAVISAADRLDTLVGFFGTGKMPTGSADPFGLRRFGIGLVRTLTAFGFDVTLRELIDLSAAVYGEAGVELDAQHLRTLEGFLWERLGSLLAAQGVGAAPIRAARATGGSAYGAAWRAALLHAQRNDEDFQALAQLYKRAANLSKDTAQGELTGRFEHDEETRLAQRLPELQRATHALAHAAQVAYPAWDPARPLPAARQDLTGPLRAVTAVKPDLDAFFDRVMVMVDDEELRTNRLRLLAGVRDAVRDVAALEELA